jgi:hypothetical protein
MANRQTTCSHCGIQFTFEDGRGKARILCSDKCRAASRDAKIAARQETYPECAYDGCGRKCRSANAGYCEKHYYRIRRNGHARLKAEVSPPPLTTAHSQGYVLEYCPGHWIGLRTGDNRIYQHRRVYFDAHGEGPFDCYWCGVLVTWDTMHVDHVNRIKHDNSLSNLVSSCPACNTGRQRDQMTATHRARSKAKIEWRGECLTIGEWAERIGITAQSLRYRLNAGWDKGRAMTEPRGVTGPMARRAAR